MWQLLHYYHIFHPCFCYPVVSSCFFLHVISSTTAMSFNGKLYLKSAILSTALVYISRLFVTSSHIQHRQEDHTAISWSSFPIYVPIWSRPRRSPHDPRRMAGMVMPHIEFPKCAVGIDLLNALMQTFQGLNQCR